MESNLAHPASDSRRWIVTAVLLTLAVRLYLLWEYYCISSDGVRYLSAAEDFFAGRVAAGLASVYPPGYPLLIAAVFPLIGDWELAGQLVSLSFSLLLLWPLYRLFEEVYDARVAGIACILSSLSPFLARYSVHVRTESPFLFFSVLALYLFYQGSKRRRLGYFLCGGLVAGFGYLIRPEAVGFLVIVPAYLGFLWLKDRPGDGWWRVKATILWGAAFMVFALPYITYLSIDTGRWGALSRKAGVTLGVSLQQYGLLEADDGGDNADAEAVEFLDFIRRHPVRYLQKIAMGVWPTVSAYFEVLHYSYVPFLLVGLWLVFRDRVFQREDFLILAFVFFNLLAFLLILVRRRYSLQVVPVSLGWVALGFLWLWDYLRASLSLRGARILFGLALLAFVGATLPKTLTAISREKGFVREAGRYLDRLRPPAKLNVAVFDGRVTFYAHANMLSLDGVEEAQLASWLGAKRADYLAIENKLWQKRFPQAAARPAAYGLVTEREFIGTRKDRMLLFKVKATGQ